MKLKIIIQSERSETKLLHTTLYHLYKITENANKSIVKKQSNGYLRQEGLGGGKGRITKVCKETFGGDAY